jgi:hypothetical protein
MQHNFIAENVIAHAVVLPANAPLAFAGTQANQFLDLMSTTAIVRVRTYGFKQFFQGAIERGILPGNGAELPLKCGRRKNSDVAAIAAVCFLLLFSFTCRSL